MNELTKRLVEQTARKYRSHALYNDELFFWHLDAQYWIDVMVYIGIDLKQYVLDLWRIDHPDHFDDEGFLINIEYDLPLSHEAERMIEDYVSRHDEWQLTDYGDYPIIYVERLQREEAQLKEEKRQRRKANVSDEQQFLFTMEAPEAQ